MFEFKKEKVQIDNLQINIAGFSDLITNTEQAAKAMAQKIEAESQKQLLENLKAAVLKASAESVTQKKLGITVFSNPFEQILAAIVDGFISHMNKLACNRVNVTSNTPTSPRTKG